MIMEADQDLGNNGPIAISKILFFLHSIFFVSNSSTSSSSPGRIPRSFTDIPEAYNASQVCLSAGFFSSLLAIIFSGKSKKAERFSLFCTMYSFVCLSILGFLYGSAPLLQETDVPLWFKRLFYRAVIPLMGPLPLTVLLSFALPLLVHFIVSAL